MYLHMNKHYKKVMKRQKNIQSNAQIAKIFCDLSHWSKTIIIEVDTCGYGRGAGGRGWMWLDTSKS